MPIQFACPHCGKQTMVDDQFAGRSGPCAACGRTVTVPGFSAMPVAAKSGSKVGLIIAAVLAIPMLCVCTGLLAALLLPAVNAAREAGRRSVCNNNFRQLALAMHNYHADHGSFPPAFTVDKNGKPLHSWRTLLLPYLEQAPLHDQIHLEQPWDSPENQASMNMMPKVFNCPSDGNHLGKSTTNYVVITGKGTIFETKPDGKGATFQDISDGLSNTILIVEVVGMDVPWMKPQDIDITEFVRRALRDGNGRAAHVGGCNSAFADGSTHFLQLTLRPDTLKALATRAGGEVLNEEDF